MERIWLALWLLVQTVWLLALGRLSWEFLRDAPRAPILLLPGLCFASVFALLARRVAGVLRGAVPADDATLRRQAFSSLVAQAALGVMSMATYPLTRDMLKVGADGALKGRLGETRHALVLYEQAKRKPPERLEELVEAGVARELPLIHFFRNRPHPDTRESVNLDPGTVTDSGRWGYSAGPSGSRVFVDCTHTDMKGNRWDSY